jgi:hypothetical protein
MRQILLITLGLSTALFASFSKNENIVTDSNTGLQWQDDSIVSGRSWTQAIDYCENLTLDTHSDWRLPNLKELTSIMDDSRTSPSIDTSAFENTASNTFWSSTTYAGLSDIAWVVDFYDGSQYGHGKSNDNPVRCVRAGQP